MCVVSVLGISTEMSRRKGGGSPYFLLVMQALKVIFQREDTLLGTAIVVRRRACDVTCHYFLPEGVAAGWACTDG
jgi:hypothetical protein